MDTEGEEGMRVIQRSRGKGWEGRKREGRRKEMTWPPNKNSWIRH
jgi:hypothetical protein